MRAKLQQAQRRNTCGCEEPFMRWFITTQAMHACVTALQASVLRLSTKSIMEEEEKKKRPRGEALEEKCGHFF